MDFSIFIFFVSALRQWVRFSDVQFQNAMSFGISDAFMKKKNSLKPNQMWKYRFLKWELYLNVPQNRRYPHESV